MKADVRYEVTHGVGATAEPTHTMTKQQKNFPFGGPFANYIKNGGGRRACATCFVANAT